MQEKREFQRFEVYRGTEIRGNQEGIRLGITKDLSRAGARLMTRAFFETGTEVQLKIIMGSIEGAQWRTARVVRTTDIPTQGRLWTREVSLVFSPPLDPTFENELLNLQ